MNGLIFLVSVAVAFLCGWLFGVSMLDVINEWEREETMSDWEQGDDRPNETHSERLKTLFEDFGVEFRLLEEFGEEIVICQEGMIGVKGYQNYLVSFRFDPNGEFVEMEIEE